jgi:hypothetical protein
LLAIAAIKSITSYRDSAIMLDLSALGISEPASTTYSPTPFGKEMLKHFQFDPAYKSLNHGPSSSVLSYLKN